MSDILQRKENETKFKYIKRLTESKKNGLVDLDYIEWYKLCFDKDISSDEGRKRFYGISDLLNVIEDVEVENVSDDEVLSELIQKKIELELERKKLQTITIQYNKILREEARNQLMFEEIKKSIIKAKPPNFEKIEYKVFHKKSGLLALGDIHYGKIFISINNKYSEEILLERMNKLLNNTIDICKKENLTHIHIINLADMIEGMCLRVSQLTTLQMGMTDMVIKYSRMMVEWLNELSRFVRITYHSINDGNHSEIRPLGSSAGQFPKENVERIISMYIKDMLSLNERVEVIVYEGVAVWDILGYTIGATHGQNIKNPSKAIKDLSYLHRILFDYLLLGHYHHSSELTVGEGNTNNCEIIITPSIMGSDNFSDLLLTGAKAGAKFLIFEENKGKSITYDIILN